MAEKYNLNAGGVWKEAHLQVLLKKFSNFLTFEQLSFTVKFLMEARHQSTPRKMNHLATCTNTKADNTVNYSFPSPP